MKGVGPLHFRAASLILSTLIIVVGVAVADAEPATTTTEPMTVFEDLSADALFAYEVAWLADTGITKGCNPAEGNTKFCPHDYVTRGQMAAFLHRASGSPAPWLRTVLWSIEGSAVDVNSEGEVLIRVYGDGTGDTRDAAIWDPEANTLMHLSDLGVDGAWAFDLSDSGYTTGWAQDGDLVKAFLWLPSAGEITWAARSDGLWTRGEAVNELGQIAGNSGDSVAFAWTPGDTDATLLDTPPGLRSGAYDINDGGTVIGTISDNSTFGKAVTWDAETGAATDVPFAPAIGRSGGAQINNSGETVGSCLVDGRWGLFAWTIGDPMAEVLSLSDLLSHIPNAVPNDLGGLELSGLNERGEVLGQVEYNVKGSTSVQFRLFVWNTRTSEVALSAPSAGYTNESLADDGMVAATDFHGNGPFLWNPSTDAAVILAEVPELDGTSTRVVGDAGLVVGGAHTTAGGGITHRVVIWTPAVA